MTALLILVMIAVPAACFAWVLRGLDPLGRATAGVAGSLSLLILVAQTMIVVRVWSPGGGLAVVAAVCVLLLLVGWRRRPVPEHEVARAAKQEDEDWIFDE
ncbi:hypothetical protein LO762_03495 [Actinocorallia sp. API 0066]|uniref:hypothetical protein n=1 Tax=Actinocorallia sp. API 0066 TaxID=2896846 RepID=UPI001E5A579F|nr:hypothetical protein [Actinocorallia sp. API 0066]MCD0448263.1 hypothetical protein [Actinocorallia sp. API 0066]